jgi:hypothetical protein
MYVLELVRNTTRTDKAIEIQMGADIYNKTKHTRGKCDLAIEIQKRRQEKKQKEKSPE